MVALKFELTKDFIAAELALATALITSPNHPGKRNGHKAALDLALSTRTAAIENIYNKAALQAGEATPSFSELDPTQVAAITAALQKKTGAMMQDPALAEEITDTLKILMEKNIPEDFSALSNAAGNDYELTTRIARMMKLGQENAIAPIQYNPGPNLIKPKFKNTYAIAQMAIKTFAPELHEDLVSKSKAKPGTSKTGATNNTQTPTDTVTPPEGVPIGAGWIEAEEPNSNLNFVSSTPPSGTRAPKPADKEKMSPGKKAGIIGGGVAAAALVGGLGYVGMRGNKEQPKPADPEPRVVQVAKNDPPPRVTAPTPTKKEEPKREPIDIVPPPVMPPVVPAPMEVLPPPKDPVKVPAPPVEVARKYIELHKMPHKELNEFVDTEIAKYVKSSYSKAVSSIFDRPHKSFFVRSMEDIKAIKALKPGEKMSDLELKDTGIIAIVDTATNLVQLFYTDSFNVHAVLEGGDKLKAMDDTLLGYVNERGTVVDRFNKLSFGPIAYAHGVRDAKDLKPIKPLKEEQPEMKSEIVIRGLPPGSYHFGQIAKETQAFRIPDSQIELTIDPAKPTAVTKELAPKTFVPNFLASDIILGDYPFDDDKVKQDPKRSFNIKHTNPLTFMLSAGLYAKELQFLDKQKAAALDHPGTKVIDVPKAYWESGVRNWTQMGGKIIPTIAETSDGRGVVHMIRVYAGKSKVSVPDNEFDGFRDISITETVAPSKDLDPKQVTALENKVTFGGDSSHLGKAIPTINAFLATPGTNESFQPVHVDVVRRAYLDLSPKLFPVLARPDIGYEGDKSSDPSHKTLIMGPGIGDWAIEANKVNNPGNPRANPYAFPTVRNPDSKGALYWRMAALDAINLEKLVDGVVANPPVLTVDPKKQKLVPKGPAVPVVPKGQMPPKNKMMMLDTTHQRIGEALAAGEIEKHDVATLRNFFAHHIDKGSSHADITVKIGDQFGRDATLKTIATDISKELRDMPEVAAAQDVAPRDLYPGYKTKKTPLDHAAGRDDKPRERG